MILYDIFIYPYCYFILLLPSVFISTPPYSEPLIFPFPVQITVSCYSRAEDNVFYRHRAQRIRS